MSTIITAQSIESDIESCSHELEQAMLRARQRADAFVNPSSSEPTSPLKPPLVHNKSNEQVKSSLKVRPGLTRANSEPSHKSVHFSSTNLEDVRQFKRTQRPSAVGRKPRFYYAKDGSSTDSGYPLNGFNINDSNDNETSEAEDDDEEDEEDDFSDVDDYYTQSNEYFRPRNQSVPLNKLSLRSRSRHETRANNLTRLTERNVQHQDWTLLTPGFHPHTYGRLVSAQRPTVYLDNIQLSSDQKNLKATIYVKNLAYDKLVAVRYSINNWATFNECQAVWSGDIRKFDRDAGYDRFEALIPFSQFPVYVLNSSTLLLCVRYSANTLGEFWDNNDGKNYDFYLRNLKLSSNSSINSQKKPSSNRNYDKNAFSDFMTSPQEPQIVLNDRSADHYEDPWDYELRSSDFLKRSGIPIRESDKSNREDPFFKRYSFATSYNAHSKKSSTHHTSPPVFTVARESIVPDADSDIEPIEVIATPQTRPETHKSTSKGLNSHAIKLSQVPTNANSPGTTNKSFPPHSPTSQAWESDSYKDFVSKYCFYTTPQSSISVSKQLSSKESSEVFPTLQKFGSSEKPTAVPDSQSAIESESSA